VENPVVNKSISLVGEDRDTTVIDVTAGLKVQHDYVTVTGLTLFDGWQGITVSARYCNISGNKVTDSQYGIVLIQSENCSVTGNIVQSVGPSAAIQLVYSNQSLVSHNYVDSCTEGIQIRESSAGNTVTQNTVVNCTDVAVRFLESGSFNVVTENQISSSGCGLAIYGSTNNTISRNNYVNNTFQASANEDYWLTWGGNRSVNTIDQNYWSDYNGTDVNKDGVGDAPYVIDSYNRDNHPLISPVNLANNSPTPTLFQQKCLPHLCQNSQLGRS
jgi:parallel beta-helix repeat protein